LDDGIGSVVDKYLLFKTIHIFGAVIFLGNIVVTGVWKALADRTRNPAIIAYSQRLVTITDFLFTALGAAIVFVTGWFFLAKDFGGISNTYWLSWGFWLFIASGVLWVGILIPVQIMQSRMAKEFKTTNEIPEQYWKLSSVWEVVGTIAVILPFSVLYFMIFKPT
jgi:uncharacterized membrane protein